jgi:hypothetical protein
LPGGGLDEDAIATRQAQFASGAVSVEDRFLMNAVVRLLQTKTGDAPVRFDLIGTTMTAISEETGISVELIQAGLGDGQTLAEIIEANGGDLVAVAAALQIALADAPQAQDQDMATYVDQLLTGDFFGGRPAQAP